MFPKEKNILVEAQPKGKEERAKDKKNYNIR
jgi:hypothetical protein